MGSDSMANCYDRNFEMYQAAYMKELNTNMIEVVSFVSDGWIPINFILLSVVILLSQRSSTIQMWQTWLLAVTTNLIFKLILCYEATIATFCSTMADLNTNAIEARITVIKIIAESN